MPQICVSQKAGTIPEKPVNGIAPHKASYRGRFMKTALAE
jgi:hypothetical protein